jgi:hypothetical protein
MEISGLLAMMVVAAGVVVRSSTSGVYVSLALSSVLLVGLSQRTTPPPRLQDIDRQLGRLSYPILLHWTIATLVAAIGGIAPARGGMLFCVTIVPLNLAAFAVASFVEGRLEHFRTRVRARSEPVPPIPTAPAV